jgi:hypothetical protein
MIENKYDAIVETLDKHQKILSYLNEDIKRQEDFASVLFSRMNDAELGIKLTWIVCFVNVLFSVGLALKICGLF